MKDKGKNIRSKSSIAIATILATLGLSGRASAEGETQLVEAQSLEGVVSVKTLSDGSLELIFENGEIVRLSPDQFVIEDGVALVPMDEILALVEEGAFDLADAEAAAEAAASAGSSGGAAAGGAAAGAAAGGIGIAGGVAIAAAAVGVAAAAGGGGGGGGDDEEEVVDPVINGTEGDDVLIGTPGDDIINGLGGNDDIQGLGGNDILNGSTGDDLIAGGGGTDTIDGGEGVDTNDFSNINVNAPDPAFPGAGVTVELNADGTGTAQYVGGGVAGGPQITEEFTGIENIIGTVNNDVIIANGAAPNTLLGLAGDDVLAGGGGTDIIDGGEGIDTNDFSNINMNAPDPAFEGAGVTVQLNEDGSGTAQYIGGGVEGGPEINEEFAGIENITGTVNNDTITATGEADNVLSGLGGNDTLIGGAGHDTLIGGGGTDFIDGGEGIDPNDFSNINVNAPDPAFEGAGVTVQLNENGSGTAQYIGGGVAGGPEINEEFLNIENITGTVNNDTFIATGEANNAFQGGLGDDFIDGGDGVDAADFSDLDVPVIIDVDSEGNGTVTRETGFSVSVIDQPLASITTEQSPEELVEEAVAGNLYFNVHTTEFPSGEIRGQLLLQSDVTDEDGVRTIVISGELDGSQEPGPFSDSAATGFGEVTIVVDEEGNVTYSSELSISGIASSELLPVAGVSAIHLHNAPAGVNGPVITDIVQDAGGDTTGVVAEGGFGDTGDGNVFNEVVETDSLQSIELITGANGNGVIVVADDVELVNDKEIAGEVNGILVQGEDFTFENNGEVSGGFNGINVLGENATINNNESGVITSDSRGVDFGASGATLNNDGLILGADDQRNGTVYVDGDVDNVEVNNNGTIDAGEGNTGSGFGVEIGQAEDGANTFELNNTGTIQGRGQAAANTNAAGDGVRIGNPGNSGNTEGTIVNSGVITSESLQGTTGGIRVVDGVSFEGTITNSGEISGVQNGLYIGNAEHDLDILNTEEGLISSGSRAVNLDGDNVTFTNEGTVVGLDDQRNGTVYLDGTADNITVENSGLIDVGEGNSGSGISTQVGSSSEDAINENINIENSGQITGRGEALPSGETAGVRFFNGSGQPVATVTGSIVNQGSALIESETSAGILIESDVAFEGTITNEGVISGEVTSIDATDSTGDIELNNSGLLAGDVILGSGDDVFNNVGGTVLGQIDLGAGDDTFITDELDAIDAGAGIDTIDLSAAEEGFIIDLDVNSAGAVGTPGQEGGFLDTPPGQVAVAGVVPEENIIAEVDDVENVIGSDFNDGIFGNNEVNVLEGGAGNDSIHGFGGNDFLAGGDDIDTALFSASPTGVVVDLNDQVSAEVFDSIVNGESPAIFAATGGAGSNVLSGFENVTGSQQDDMITGDENDNVLIGNGGNDTLIGGTGDDSLTGGIGNDRFEFNEGDGADVITDFDTEQEVIQLTNVVLSAEEAAELAIDDGEGNTVIDFGNGDQITLNGVSAEDVTAANFDVQNDPAPAFAEVAEAEEFVLTMLSEDEEYDDYDYEEDDYSYDDGDDSDDDFDDDDFDDVEAVAAQAVSNSSDYA